MSTNTIRNAIHRLEQEGRLYRVRSVGTFVRPAACPDAESTRTTIALLVPDLDSPFGTEIAHTVEQACRTRGWRLEICDHRLDPRLEIDHLSRLTNSGAKGAIVVPTCDDRSMESLFQLKLSGFPFVLVDRTIRGLRVDFVGANHAKAGFLATSHLLEHGHRRILALAGRPLCSSVEQRICGYEEAMFRYGCYLHPDCRVWYDWRLNGRNLDETARWQPARTAMLSALQNLSPPLAVFALDEFAACGAIEACRTLGLSVPADVSLVCFEDSEFSQAITPPLTAVGQPLAIITKRAVALLETRLKVPQADPRHVLFDVELVRRQSAASHTGALQENVA